VTVDYALSNPTRCRQISMVDQDAKQVATIRCLRTLRVLMVIILATAMSASVAHAETTSIERSATVDLVTGDWLSVSSNTETLQSVEITGNLSAVELPSALHYPTNSFNITSHTQGSYSVTLTFDFPSEYSVGIVTNQSNATRKEIASYYLSMGQLILTIELNFSAPDPILASAHSTGWGEFLSWTTRFGAAFPFWVKLLYAVLGIQFVAVGYKWIRFENDTRRKKSSVPGFDRGNLLYLSSEVLYKLLLATFLVIAAVMSGQLILLLILRFMFLAQVDMLNLWDLYVLGFAAGIAVIAYCFKFVLQKSFDLNPSFGD
jgi:hypothetical protein